MKLYQKSINISNPTPDKLEHLPSLTAIDPALYTTISRYYDHTGTYIGWCTPEVTKKFLYGSLYYKTKGSIRIYTEGRGDEKKIALLDKRTNKTHLIIDNNSLGDKELIDTDSKLDKAKFTLQRFQGEVGKGTFSASYTSRVSDIDEYKLIPTTIHDEARNRYNELIEAHSKDLAKLNQGYTQEILQYTQSVIDAEQLIIEQSKASGIQLGI